MSTRCPPLLPTVLSCASSPLIDFLPRSLLKWPTCFRDSTSPRCSTAWSPSTKPLKVGALFTRTWAFLFFFVFYICPSRKSLVQSLFWIDLLFLQKLLHWCSLIPSSMWISVEFLLEYVLLHAQGFLESCTFKSSLPQFICNWFLFVVCKACFVECLTILHTREMEFGVYFCQLSFVLRETYTQTQKIPCSMRSLHNEQNLEWNRIPLFIPHCGHSQIFKEEKHVGN